MQYFKEHLFETFLVALAIFILVAKLSAGPVHNELSKTSEVTKRSVHDLVIQRGDSFL